MATYVTRKCPKCKYAFERISLDWIAFGDPRIECPKCGQIVIFKNIREWNLYNPLFKFWIIFRHYVFHNMVFTLPVILGFFLILAILLAIMGKSIDEVILEENSFFFWSSVSIIVFFIIAYIRHKRFIKEIKKSNERMKDQTYADTMKEIKRRFK